MYRRDDNRMLPIKSPPTNLIENLRPIMRMKLHEVYKYDSKADLWGAIKTTML